MSDPFLAEIKMVSFDFPPKGWALCNGQLLPINQTQGAAGCRCTPVSTRWGRREAARR